MYVPILYQLAHPVKALWSYRGSQGEQVRAGKKTVLAQTNGDSHKGDLDIVQEHKQEREQKKEAKALFAVSLRCGDGPEPMAVSRYLQVVATCNKPVPCPWLCSMRPTRWSR